MASSKRKNSGGKRKGGSFGKAIFTVIVCICAAALCLSYLSVVTDPAKFALPMFFGLFYIPLAAINIFLLIIAVAKGRKSMIISILALVPALCFAEQYVKIGKEEKPHEGKPLKVVTYNVGRYSAGGQKESSAAKAAHIKEFLQREDADVVCLQEFSATDTSTMRSILPDLKYKHCHFFKGKQYFGNITLSRYPIVHSDRLSFSHSTNLCIWNDINVNGKIVRIYNCHLESYAISFTSMIKKIGQKGKITDEVEQVGGKMRGTTIRRREQVAMLMEDIAKSKYPVILCGDLNDTPMSYTYHRLASERKDSFLDGGSGFSSTYSVLWPLLRIDYILLPENCSADDHRVTRVGFSDHYPVSTLIYFE